MGVTAPGTSRLLLRLPHYAFKARSLHGLSVMNRPTVPRAARTRQARLVSDRPMRHFFVHTCIIMIIAMSTVQRTDVAAMNDDMQCKPGTTIIPAFTLQRTKPYKRSHCACTWEKEIGKLKVTWTINGEQGSSRWHLRSARCHQLSVPRVRRSTFGTRAFSVAAPAGTNSLEFTAWSSARSSCWLRTI